MTELHRAFVSRSFLRSVWAIDYEEFKGSDEEKNLVERLERWSKRKDLKETSAEAAFIEEFFRATWGYVQSGQAGSEKGFTIYPKLSIPGAGAKGGSGEADLAMGFFTKDGAQPIPQVLCEFKDIKSALDAPQKRKGNNRSPVKQCLDYLSHARRGMFGNESVLPTWGLVTDMNEFRLYWFDRGHQQSLRFTIRPTDLFQGPNLLAENEDARFDRFLFARLFHFDNLLSTVGRSPLAQLISRQWVRERELENEFYSDYRAFREHLYLGLLEHNGEGTERFPGTKGRLVRLAQKILDRCLFIFFCEDMGRALRFPPKLLREFLIHESRDAYFKPDANTIWSRLLELFYAMNDGTAFGGETINEFNGGLFANDKELERLRVPNAVFCVPQQGQNEESLYAHKLTLLYLSASYNYASDWAVGVPKVPLSEVGRREASSSLGLYTLGRIFEQSITELEILEAEADGRPSLNKESKRKRDGVYYTPEWVVERIVTETLGPKLAEIKHMCGWPEEGGRELPDAKAIDAYELRLKTFRVLDPACGSGAFLITALRYLLDEWHATQEVRRQVTKSKTIRDDDELIREILANNIYGVDINPASVEIAQLALWLHTARGDKPLSSLAHTIRCGNSLIDSNFYRGQIDLAFYDATERERVNAFDWEQQFPEVFDRKGFDAVVGNPPYVKLQNFKTVHRDMADYLKDGRPEVELNGYRSAQTGNFDLYLPFIEKGLSLLNEKGRLGYIAPSLWTVNEYGEGLRKLIAERRNLERWIDFKSFQVFEEVTTYTALQFFTKAPNDAIQVATALDGIISQNPWARPGSSLPYGRQVFGDRWLLLTGEERALIDRLYEHCPRLDDPSLTTQIYQGLITSADAIYHLERIGPGRYLCSPKGEKAPPPYEVEIEDAIMKPLVSGPEAKRYIDPKTETYLLFPYHFKNEVRLIDPKDFAKNFPKAWAYLRSYKDILCLREARRDKNEKVTEAPFDDDQWYRFGRHQNLDKQEIAKLIVAQTVPELRVCFDATSSIYLNNVRVNGIIPSDDCDPWFLLGVLNAPVADFVFRRIAKVKEGGYYEANKQFIAPLPVPPADNVERANVSRRAKKLQSAHTNRRDLLDKIEKRVSTTRLRSRLETWLFPDLKLVKELLAEAPGKLDYQLRREWANTRFEQNLAARYDAITPRIAPGATLDAGFEDGELSFSIDGVPIVDRIFVDKEEGAFILAQWKVLASTYSITEKTDGKKFCAALRKLCIADQSALVKQIIDLEQELSALESDIAKQEKEINEVISCLYRLTKNEIRLVETG